MMTNQQQQQQQQYHRQHSSYHNHQNFTKRIVVTISCFVIMLFCFVPMTIFQLKISTQTTTISFEGIPHLLTSSTSSSSTMSTVTLNDAINSATGTLFLGEVIRKFPDHERRFGQQRQLDVNLRGSVSQQEKEPPITKKNSTTSSTTTTKIVEKCDKWNVVTTIFAPSEAVKRAANVAGWCTVIVADTKTPSNYMEDAGLISLSQVHFLSVQDQEEWYYNTTTTRQQTTKRQLKVLLVDF